MERERPSPEALLERANEEEARGKHGRLTIFFGAAAGVGKTYAMLEAARTERDLRRDVVVGVAETHGRYDTAALLLGLEILPRGKVAHRGIVLEEFDIDAALRRKPGLILLDELAHTNCPGMRHAKRWQDAQELLDAGIDVYTTLNVQHIESLNDVVAQITGVVVRETVPDRVFDTAHDVRLVDILPDELLERLGEGKVYVREQAARATDHFFRKGNLIALRELALRRTAERVDAQMAIYRRDHGIQATWAVCDRVLVSISPSPSSVHLVRAAKRMASSLRAPWIAAYVEKPGSMRMPAAARDRATQTLRLAEELGAETVTLSGANAAEEIVQYARSRNVTKLVVGKPTHARWRDRVSPSFLDDIVRTADMDVYVISGDRGIPTVEQAGGRPVSSHPRSAFVGAIAVVAAATALGALLFGRQENTEVVMIYLLGIVLVSVRFGYAPSIFATLLSIVCLDFFFIPPYYSFAVEDVRHLVTFVVLFVVAIVISSLTRRVHEQADAARGRERRTAALYALSRELGTTRSLETLLRVALRHIDEAFESHTTISLPNGTGRLKRVFDSAGPTALDPKEEGAAEWVWENQRPAGRGTDTLPSGQAMHIPISASRGRVGVLSVTATDSQRFQDPEQTHLLQAFASQVGLAIERALFAAEKRAAELQAESEQVRNALCSSVSHDLRTPLDMRRLESGALPLNKECLPIQDVVGAALRSLEHRLADRKVTTNIPPDLPRVAVDGVLIAQVVTNLVENAIEYTPPKSPIEISASQRDSEVMVEVADHGPGVPPEEAERIFHKFDRIVSGVSTEGTGLGLPMSRGIIAAHHGKLWVDARSGGGSVFRFTLPLEGGGPRASATAADGPS